MLDLVLVSIKTTSWTTKEKNIRDTTWVTKDPLTSTEAE